MLMQYPEHILGTRTIFKIIGFVMEYEKLREINYYKGVGNKKVMKKIIILLILGLSVILVSCEKSDSKDTSYSSMIVGTWKAYKMWENSYWREIDDEIYLIFQKDGLCKYVESYNGTVYEDPYTWKINENQLFMDYVGDDDGVSDESKKRINLLTEEELIIEFSMPGEHWKEHFVRVK